MCIYFPKLDKPIKMTDVDFDINISPLTSTANVYFFYLLTTVIFLFNKMASDRDECAKYTKQIIGKLLS